MAVCDFIENFEFERAVSKFKDCRDLAETPMSKRKVTYWGSLCCRMPYAETRNKHLMDASYSTRCVGASCRLSAGSSLGRELLSARCNQG